MDRTTLLLLIAQFFEFPTGTCCSQEYHGLPSAHQTQWEYAFICTCMRPCAWLKALTVSRLRSITGPTVPFITRGKTYLFLVLTMPCAMLSAWLLFALSSADLSDPDKGLSEEKEQALASPYAQLITSHFQLFLIIFWGYSGILFSSLSWLNRVQK